MSYKFQVGAAVQSGSLTQEGALIVKDDLTANNTIFQVIRNTGVVSGSGQMHMVGNCTYGGTLATSGSITSKGGVAAGGAISGVTSLDGSGDLTMGTITMTGFSVDADGDTQLKTLSASSTVYAAGAATFSSTIAATGSITAGSSFIIGSADLNETDMEKLDGITNGTAAANKAVVLDGSKNIATIGTVGCGAITSTGASTMGSLGVGAVSSSAGVQVVGTLNSIGAMASSGSITAGTSFIIGSADMSETDLEKLDGITNGSVAASKAIVVDANKDFSGMRHMSGSGNLEMVGSLSLVGNIFASGSTVQLGGITADTALDVDNDGLYFRDNNDQNKMKNVEIGSFLTDIAGAGISVVSNQLAVQGNAVSEIHSGQTAAEGYNFIASAVTASHSILLPTSPSVGDVVTIKTNSGVTAANYVQLSSSVGDSLIDDVNFIRIESPFGSVTVFYADDSPKRWKIV